MKSVLAGAGCATVLVLAGVVGWTYREQLTEAYRAFRGMAPSTEEVVAAGPGRASVEALASARRKHERMSRADGPELISLSAAEMASLVQAGLDPLGRRALDSLTVTLEAGHFVMEALLVTDVWGRDALGLLGGLLQPYEPLRVAGPARLVRRGVLAWEPVSFSVRSIPFPGPTIPPIVNRLTGGDDGLVLLGIPATVADVRIGAGSATFYRRVQ